ncbi:MAG: ThiF family adenylyltransferase [Pirellulales bacterium]
MSYNEDRYSRQIRFHSLGDSGQKLLSQSRVTIVGCGALGSMTAMAFARAGIGTIRLIDRDMPELSNLPRQILFDEHDIQNGLPKAAAAKHHLKRINSEITIEETVADLTADNADRLLSNTDCIVDGTDNFETRFLINDFCCREHINWVYGGAIAAEGRVLAIQPRTTACLRCLIPHPPPSGSMPTCETAGIIGPAAYVVGAIQASETIKLLTGVQNVGKEMFVCDLWEGICRTIDLSPLAEVGCPTCKEDDFPWLEKRISGSATVLCGRDAVQVSPPNSTHSVDLASLAKRLESIGPVTVNDWLVRLEIQSDLHVSIFPDGRAIVSGTREETKARSIVSRYLGT